MSNVFSSPSEMKVSRKGIELSLVGGFRVNWMCGSMELMCCRIWLLCSTSWMTKLSSTYLSHNHGGWVAALMTLISINSMNRLGSMGLMDCPMYLVIILMKRVF